MTRNLKGIKSAFYQMMGLRLRVYALFLVTALFSSAARSADFSDAQAAAGDGRYRDVIVILTELLDDQNLDEHQQLIAYANRGIAYSLLNAFGVARQDLLQALEIDANHTLTLNQLGIIAEEVDGNYAQAVGYFNRASEQQFGPAQHHLAKLYRDGKGLTRDLPKALGLYQAAVKNKNAMSLVPLGEMLLLGQATPVNTIEAFNLFKQAVEAGIITGYFQLGLAYDLGRGTERNINKSIENYYFAAMQGHADAQNMLGYLYRKGRGVKQDWKEAARWYELAAEQGNTDAMNRLSWVLAGCPTTSLCDADRSVKLAVRAISIQVRSSYRDSLAAGYARSKDFDKAIKVLEGVLASMDPNDARATTYQNRLNQYKQHRPMQL